MFFSISGPRGWGLRGLEGPEMIEILGRSGQTSPAKFFCKPFSNTDTCSNCKWHLIHLQFICKHVCPCRMKLRANRHFHLHVICKSIASHLPAISSDEGDFLHPPPPEFSQLPEFRVREADIRSCCCAYILVKVNSFQENTLKRMRYF